MVERAYVRVRVRRSVGVRARARDCVRVRDSEMGWRRGIEGGEGVMGEVVHAPEVL